MSGVALPSVEASRPLGERGAVRLALPARSRHDAGILIRDPRSPDLIPGVQVERLQLWPDDRGYFLELARLGQGLSARMQSGQCQVSCAFNYPGTIKALHYHFEQHDLWSSVEGQLQVCLVDLRVDARSFGLCNTFFIGPLQPWQVLIPPGIGHGYKVVGTQPATLVYLTDRFYNPADEGRLPYDDPGINYDWETQQK